MMSERFMRQELEKYSDEVIQDRLGGVFGVRKGEGPRVMVAGHMDEVGFMVTQITKNGMLRFQPLGGCGTRSCLHNVFKS